MTSSANVDLVRSRFAAWERGDFKSAEWADPEIEFVVIGGPEPGSRKGLEDITPRSEDFLSLWDSFRVEAEEYRELDNERVLVMPRAIGRGRSSGVEIDQRRASLFHVVLASAEQLPFGDASFTAVAMSVVFFFLPDPVAVLRECRRVLRAGGRIAVYTTAPELRGTPAAPEPVASHGHFYQDEELTALAHQAGLANIVVADDHGGQLLTASA